MANSRDGEELKYYWLEWRHKTGPKIEKIFTEYIRILNQLAMDNGNMIRIDLIIFKLGRTFFNPTFVERLS